MASDGRYYPPDPSAVPPPVPDASVPADWSGSLPPEGQGFGGLGSPKFVPVKRSINTDMVVFFRLVIIGLLAIGVLAGGVLVVIPGPAQPDLQRQQNYPSSSSSDDLADPHPYAGDGALLIFFAILQCVVLIPAAPKIVDQRDTVT